jgi:adenylate cyclase
MPAQEPKTRRRGIGKTILLGSVIVIVTLGGYLHYPSMLSLAELKAFDLRIASRSRKPPLGVVVIATLDDVSIAKLGRWPWPRTVFARLVTALTDYKVAVIGFDVMMSEPDTADVQSKQLADRLKAAGLDTSSLSAAMGLPNDQVFADAIKAQGATIMGFPFDTGSFTQESTNTGFVNIVTEPAPMTFGLVREPPGTPPPVQTAQTYLPNIPVIAGAARANAYFTVSTDADAIIRAETMVTRFQSRYYAPLILAVISTYAKGALLSLTLAEYGVSDVAIGDTDIPCDESGHMLINYRGPARTFPYYSISDIIDHKLSPDALTGRIVLVGATARGVGDRWSTPMGADFPGVEIHANAIDNILAGDFFQRSNLTQQLEILAGIILGLLSTVAIAFLSPLWAFATTAVLGAGYFAFSQYMLFGSGMMVGVLFPFAEIAVTGGLLGGYRYLTEGREKRYLRHAFAHYLDPGVVESLINNPEGLKLGGERRHLAILFADILNFTARAERSNPEELVALLNTYMTAMTNIILSTGGVVDKLMGDGIMAFWGAPKAVANPARAAVDSALLMLAELNRLRRTDPRFADLDIGLGIATGDVTVGNFGGEKRFDYSVIGDTANLGSRLEGLTRQFKVHLIVNYETFTEAAGPYVAREIGLVRVKGKAQPVRIMEIVGRQGDGVDASYYEKFAHVVEIMRDAPVDTIRQQLEELSKLNPDDHVVQMHLRRLHLEQPESGSELVFEFDTK